MVHAHQSSAANGRLFYMVGPSGAGKDTLLSYARARLDGSSPIAIAHRYITRRAHDSSENHIALSPQEFAARSAVGLFAMEWHSNDQHYGIGIEIRQWLVRGINVLVNGSRGYLPEALARFPELRLLLVTASPESLKARLAQRGREDGTAIDARLARSDAFYQLARTPDLHICNDRRPEEAGDRLVRYLSDHCGVGVDRRVANLQLSGSTT